MTAGRQTGNRCPWVAIAFQFIAAIFDAVWLRRVISAAGAMNKL